ncbi:hypothetical protein ACS0TY_024344 [Phlomoides rotata]
MFSSEVPSRFGISYLGRFLFCRPVLYAASLYKFKKYALIYNSKRTNIFMICFRVRKNNGVNVSLGVLECEIFSVSPIKMFNENIQFAPIGLINMYNSGGSVEDCTFDYSITVKVRGAGLFGAYSNRLASSNSLQLLVPYFANSISRLLLSVDGAHAASCEEMATTMSSAEGDAYKGLQQCIETVMSEVERLLSAEQKATDYRSPDDGITPDHRPTNACIRHVHKHG